MFLVEKAKLADDAYAELHNACSQLERTHCESVGYGVRHDLRYIYIRTSESGE